MANDTCHACFLSPPCPSPLQLANAKLREALAAAKAAQCPVDIIERNIKRASESKADYAEVRVMCEGGPG